jgi:Pyridoxamine 5'-phosphate oxidase
MDETEAELQSLQLLLDQSFARSSAHLLAIMTEPRRLDARRLVAELSRICVLNVASVTAGGEPRVSAVDGHFLHGHWYFSTDGSASKARQLAARPGISAAYTPRDGLGVFCHGQARRLDRGTAEFEMLTTHWIEAYGVSFDALSDDIACMRIDANWLVGFAMTDDEMADIEAAAAARAARAARREAAAD